jgi:hypothetical protein
LVLQFSWISLRQWYTKVTLSSFPVLPWFVFDRVMYLDFTEHVPAEDNVVTECCHVYVLMGRAVAMVLDPFFLKEVVHLIVHLLLFQWNIIN